MTASSVENISRVSAANLVSPSRNVTMAGVIFSRVKITCYLKAHLVFHWCLYNNLGFSLSTALLTLSYLHIEVNPSPGKLPHISLQSFSYAIS